MSPLTREMRQVLAELELVSHGATQAWNPSGGQSGEPDDRFVALVASQPRSLMHPDQPPHLRFRALWDRACTDEARAAILEDAQKELREITGLDAERRSTIHVLSDGEILDRHIIEAVGSTPDEIAQRYHTTPRIVRKMRLRSGLESEDGTPRPTIPIETAEFIRDLYGRGYTQAEISRALQISQPTVSRLLRTRRREAA